jgi:UDP-N-acetylglucosamine 2-epimerase (non-hydrolysing)
VRVLTVFGTRPEIIRLSEVIRRLDAACEHTLVYTGQNYDPLLSDVFFEQLGVRRPDVHLGVRASGFAEQAAAIVAGIDAVLAERRPDRVVILGDTNSGLAAIPAARRRIPVYHLEAGNRCYDDRVPEEINRRIIDHCSTVLLPYTQRSAENLVREGIERHRIFVTGNPILEVLEAHRAAIDASGVLRELSLERGRFFLVTLHRAENVDLPDRLAEMMRALALIADTYGQPVVVSVHPRTADRLARSGIAAGSAALKLLPPLGLIEFVHLESASRAVLTDSGTVQEECCIFGIPNVTLRDVTERPETIEAGSNILSGGCADDILRALTVALSRAGGWAAPEEYLRRGVSQTIANIVLGYRPGPDEVRR